MELSIWYYNCMIIYLSLINSEEDKNLFENVYKCNYELMYYVALKLLKEPVEAENAVHEAFLTLAENFERYKKIGNNGSDFKGLCVTIVKNKVIDYFRKQKHMSDVQIENLVFYSEDSSLNPEDNFMHNEQMQLVQRILGQLPELYKETLILKYYYDYSIKEISRIMNVPPKTVEQRLYRGKKKISILIEEDKNDAKPIR